MSPWCAEFGIQVKRYAPSRKNTARQVDVIFNPQVGFREAAQELYDSVDIFPPLRSSPREEVKPGVRNVTGLRRQSRRGRTPGGHRENRNVQLEEAWRQR